MASKKPASKVRKVLKPLAAQAGARKVAAHRAEPRKAPASTHRSAVARATTRPAARALLARGGEPKPEHKPEPREPAKSATSARGAPAAPARAPSAPARPVTTPPAPVARLVPRAPVDADEGELGDPGSLLAGPRNVKPYIAKRGEQYMGKQQLGHFQQILTSWKRDLMVEVDRTVTHMKDEAANFPDPNDRATQEEEFSLELRTRDRERKLIRKIDEALKRIEDGSYGYCLETGEEIGIKRLEARPVATLSLEAQERRERRERQYGDRDDRYR